MIKLTDIWKSYQLDQDVVFTALKGVSMEIKQGEFTAITGPSGSGKSTLMQIVGLLDKPSKGIVEIEGKDVSKLNDNETSLLRNEFIGFVFQQFNLINKLNIVENIMLPMMYTRKKIDYDPREKAFYYINRFGLGGKEYSYPNKISGGQQQRVAIARALIMNPRLILADEPTGNLDTKTGEEIFKILKELNEEDKITVVIVTHAPDIAKRAKRVIQVVDGELVQ